MENKKDLEQSLKVIKRVADNPSWFGEYAHRWPQASLPLAYAMACVEVVSKQSEKASMIYNQIIEAWGDPSIKAVFEKIRAEIPDADMEEVRQAFIHPENEFLPDPNKPFRNLEEMFGLEIHEDLLDADDAEQLSPEEQKDAEELAALISLIFEFIIVGFNRESGMKKGRYRVTPTEKAPWLIFAVLMRTSFENYNITLDRLRVIYKLRKYKGEIIDFHEVLTQQPMSRWHRRMVAAGKAAKLNLKNDQIFVNAARHWYQCRVAYSNINKFCDAQSEKGIILDPKNVNKQIRPCDEAVGYIRRLPRNTTN